MAVPGSYDFTKLYIILLDLEEKREEEWCGASYHSFNEVANTYVSATSLNNINIAFLLEWVACRRGKRVGSVRVGSNLTRPRLPKPISNYIRVTRTQISLGYAGRTEF